ncbi:sugar kinase [Rhodococcus fascians]|nr:sugar kinase [Rhodococcus fascians]
MDTTAADSPSVRVHAVVTREPRVFHVNAQRPHLLTLGECMGRLTPERIGLLEHAGDLTLHIGGAEANVAVAVARLGVAATWMGRLGRDSVGDLIERRLSADGVNVRAVRDPYPTGLMICTRRTAATVEVDYHRHHSAGSHLHPSDLSDDLFDDADLLHITGITPALSPGAAETVFEAIDRARRHGSTVSFDVNYRTKLWKPREAAPVLQKIAALSDIVFAGPEEAELLLDVPFTSPAAAARAIAAMGPREVVVKRGAEGCTALVDGAIHNRAALATVVTDPIGAGDAFVGGYLADYLTGEPVDTRLRTALQMGAAAVSVPGDCENLPYRTELDSLSATTDVVR